ncbi:hypothetical protein [Larsenimonas salina]|uniref:hypothetical protein n=1 Tax=Larsenimonas salina TaxID=1295565 RepID=UPI002073239E|nr:hypothetical protein [Larsenimonas salina]MCM5703393.1 hypothetical protein [Larsenimonas salina]
MPQYTDRIGAFGASIMWMTGNGNEDAEEMQFRLAQVGLPQSSNWVTGMAVSGRTVEGYVSKLDDMLAPMNGAKKGLVLVHGPGNSVSENEPYSGAREKINQGMRTVLKGIEDKGLIPIYLDCFIGVQNRPNLVKPQHIIEKFAGH